MTPKPKRRPRPHRALDETEREEVPGALHCERFVDKAPAQVWATLLDEGTYLCSIRTMYRILEEHGEVRERRNQRRHPNYTKPELLAEAPNQVWSWDITKLPGLGGSTNGDAEWSCSDGDSWFRRSRTSARAPRGITKEVVPIASQMFRESLVGRIA